jgi:hypothetical protein
LSGSNLALTHHHAHREAINLTINVLYTIKRTTSNTKHYSNNNTLPTIIMTTLLPEEEKYNRWELQDPSLLDFGYFSSQSPPSQNGGYYITTAINYTNGPAHMGHAYEAATADALARFHRLFEPTYFVTGSDEHGQKVANMATEGQAPIDICNKASYCIMKMCIK